MVTCEYHRNMFWSVIYSVQISLQCTNKFSLSRVEWQTKREIFNQLSSVSVIILWNYLNSLKIIIIINLKVLLYICNLRC